MMKRLKTMIPPMPWHEPREREGEGDRVVMLHGLWRSVWAMEELAGFLNDRGFETLNLPYPSFRQSIDDIVGHVAREIGISPKRTHFVTHSMGGIVLRCLAKRHPEMITGKVVMLAPPNQGSEIIDWLEDSVIGKLSLGPGGMSLSTNHVRSEIPSFAEHHDISVIMGSNNRMSAFNFLLQGENDGIVTVEGGRVGGVKRLEVVDADHTFIMSETRVIERVAELLEN
ncbi:MAG: alpha/beta fold hydrolase [Akkermansiaceae bacterium]